MRYNERGLVVYRVVIGFVYFMLAVLVIIGLNSCSSGFKEYSTYIDKSKSERISYLQVLDYSKTDTIRYTGKIEDMGNYYKILVRDTFNTSQFSREMAEITKIVNNLVVEINKIQE